MIDVPGPPSNCRVKDSTNTSVTLAWNRPAYNGGSPVTGYLVESVVLEKADDQIEDCESWRILASDVINTSFEVKKLSGDKFYLLRVSAINKGGVGESAMIKGLLILS